jgi:hypothetical protein
MYGAIKKKVKVDYEQNNSLFTRCLRTDVHAVVSIISLELSTILLSRPFFCSVSRHQFFFKRIPYSLFSIIQQFFLQLGKRRHKSGRLRRRKNVPEILHNSQQN